MRNNAVGAISLVLLSDLAPVASGGLVASRRTDEGRETAVGGLSGKEKDNDGAINSAVSRVEGRSGFGPVLSSLETTIPLYVDAVGKVTSMVSRGTGTLPAICIGALNPFGDRDDSSCGIIDDIHVVGEGSRLLVGTGRDAGTSSRGAGSTPLCNGGGTPRAWLPWGAL